MLHESTLPKRIDPGEKLRQELYELVRTDPRIFEFLQAGSLDGVWYWNLEDPAHEWMSPRFWTTFGYDPNERQHLASEWQDMIDPQDLELAKANVARHLEDPSHPYDLIVRYEGNGGKSVWVRCRGIAIRDSRGVPIRMLGAHTDVTALKLAEAELQRNNEKLKTVNDDLEALAYATSHDIKSPLRSLFGLLQILQEDHGQQLDAEGRKVLELAAGAVTRLQRTVSGVVDFASVTGVVPDLVDVDLADVMAGLLEDLSADIRETNAEIVVGPLPRLQTIPSAVSHVLSNLLSNALKYRKPAPTIPKIEVSAEETADEWVFSVCDNGSGIDPEYRERLFKPFTRLHRSDDTPGAGLGLAICRRCMNLLGGRIWIDPHHTDGTTIHFSIPTEVA